MRQRDNWCINDSYICYGRTFFHDLAQLGLEKYHLNHEHLQVTGYTINSSKSKVTHTSSANCKQNINHHNNLIYDTLLSLFFIGKKTYYRAQFFCKQNRQDSSPINLFQNWTCNNIMLLWNWFEISETLIKRAQWLF